MSTAYRIGGETGLSAGPSPFGIAGFPSGGSGGGGSSGPTGGGPVRLSAPAEPSKKAAPSKPAKTGSTRRALSRAVILRARSIGKKINATGGYRFDGYNDCYGFMRRTWDAILTARRRPKLPVNDAVSRAWRPIRDWNALKPGDVLSTHQGHAWGAHWHGGLYFGKIDGRHLIYDNSGSRDGAYIRSHLPGLFRYYYGRTHDMLVNDAKAK